MKTPNFVHQKQKTDEDKSIGSYKLWQLHTTSHQLKKR